MRTATIYVRDSTNRQMRDHTIEQQLERLYVHLHAQGETLGSEAIFRLWAVAKFHRNKCYEPDLSKEYGSPGVDWNECRSNQEEIVVSQAAHVPAGVNADAQQITFLFPTLIPISATDLFLQVVYRGPLGQENDAVVVATKDISEPTYFYNFSTLDQYTHDHFPNLFDGTNTWAQWCEQGYASLDICNRSNGPARKLQFSPTASPIPGYDPASAAVPPSTDTWTDLSLEPPFTPLATMAAPVGTMARIAVLIDASPSNFALSVDELINTPLEAKYQSSVFQWGYGTPRAMINQLDPATNTLTPSVTYLPGRGIYIPEAGITLLTSGTATYIPPLIPVPSQINF